jgi:hypothetical protein
MVEGCAGHDSSRALKEMTHEKEIDAGMLVTFFGADSHCLRNSTFGAECHGIAGSGQIIRPIQGG